MRHGHADLIDRLDRRLGGRGGGSEVARALIARSQQGIPTERMRERVYQWKSNGIAWPWRAHVRRLAEAMGEEVPADLVDAPINVAQALQDVERKVS